MEEKRVYVRPVVDEVRLDAVYMLAHSPQDAVMGDLPGTDFGGSAMENDIIGVDAPGNNGWELW